MAYSSRRALAGSMCCRGPLRPVSRGRHICGQQKDTSSQHSVWCKACGTTGRTCFPIPHGSRR
eukprot:1850280-Prymnesium_polylepis.1